MTKVALPILLASVVMIAGIFAFMPIDKATTVHTTIQGSQLNNVLSTVDIDLSTNSTASCASGDFVVHYVFTNGSMGEITGQAPSYETQLGIDDHQADSVTSDIIVTLLLGNYTSTSGSIGGTSGENIVFYGNSSGATSGASNFHDTGDLALTVVCQSTAAPTASNGD